MKVILMTTLVCPCCASPIDIDASGNDSTVAKLVVCELCDMAFDYDPPATLTPAFTITCTECDAGMEIEAEDQALREDWTELQPAYDLPTANYCGLCPECRAAMNS